PRTVRAGHGDRCGLRWRSRNPAAGLARKGKGPAHAPPARRTGVRRRLGTGIAAVRPRERGQPAQLMDALWHERKEHRRWRLKPEFESYRAFDMLLENEFLSPQDHATRLAKQVRSVVGFSAQYVPYYARMFAKLGLRADAVAGPDDLPKLPAL